MKRRSVLVAACLLTACGSRVLLPSSGEGSTGVAMDGSSASGDQTPAATTQPEPDPTSGPFESSGSTSTTTGTVDDGDSGCAFLCPDDTTDWAECDVFNQDCPPGEKCSPYANDGGSSWNALRCSPVDPKPDADGAPCTVEGSPVSGIDTCEVGSMCWNVDLDTGLGICTPHCIGSHNDPFCDDPGLQCVIGGDGVLALCLPSCDPLDPDACEEGHACYGVDNGFTCAPDASGKGGGAFEPCEFINGCDPGTVCVGSGVVGVCEGGSASCCAPYCDLEAPRCPPDTACTPFFDQGSTPPGFENVGVCLGAMQ